MPFKLGQRGLWGGIFVLLLGSIVLYLVSLSKSPNQELVFVREVPSTLSQIQIGKAIHELKYWPQWFFSLKEVKAVNSQGMDRPAEEQLSWVGALLKFNMEPPGKSWKRFELYFEITDYRPGDHITLTLHSDSTQRITRLFDHLEWKIELLPQNGGVLIRGTLKAHTAHWKSRIISQIAAGSVQRVMLNQLFYPDLQKLAHLETR